MLVHDQSIFCHLFAAAGKGLFVDMVGRVEVYLRDIFVTSNNQLWSKGGCLFGFGFFIQDAFEFIPGHSCEIGVELCEWLLDSGASVRVYYAGCLIEERLLVVGIRASFEKIPQPVREHLNIGL